MTYAPRSDATTPNRRLAPARREAQTATSSAHLSPRTADRAGCGGAATRRTTRCRSSPRTARRTAATASNYCRYHHARELRDFSGGGEIRTLEPLARPTVFETA